MELGISWLFDKDNLSFSKDLLVPPDLPKMGMFSVNIP